MKVHHAWASSGYDLSVVGNRLRKENWGLTLPVWAGPLQDTRPATPDWPTAAATATRRNAPVVYDASQVESLDAIDKTPDGSSHRSLTMSAWLFGHEIRWQRGHNI